MRNLYQESYYTADDLHEAFDLGLDTALFILERIAGLSYCDQIEIFKQVKRHIEESKDVRSYPCHGSKGN
jgi:hypothetical protein